MSTKPDTRTNNKSFRHQGISNERSDRGGHKKGGKGTKNINDD